MEWLEISGSSVLVPRYPIAIIHFLGGAFVGTAPNFTYRWLLEELAKEGYAIIATPFVNTFDHLAIARNVLNRFEGILDRLQTNNSLGQGYLPIYGIGHSMGCKLHLLIGSLFSVERAGNVLISFNNYPVKKAIPFLEQLDIENYLNLEFTPSPDETKLIIEKDYLVRRNLLVKFTDDNIDETKILEPILDDSLVSPDQIKKIQEKIQKWFEETYLSKLDLSEKLKKFNSKPEERSFIFKIIESNYNLYQSNILDEFKLIDELQRKEIHSLNFKLGKNVIFNSELIRPEYMKLKFYLWNIYHNENFNIDEYIPKDGNATLNIQDKLNEDLTTFLGFISQDSLLIRLDIFNEFEKLLFKRENRGPFSLPMDLSNLLGIKKDKLISILKNRSLIIQGVAENDLVISKKIKLNKKLEVNQNKSKKLLKKPLKKVKNSSPKRLFNNPFDQLKNINVK